jgi:hypothetical protein
MKNYKISHCGLSYLQLANCSIVMNSEILVVFPKKKKKKKKLPTIKFCQTLNEFR